jgi:peptidoglycan/xylan/chitin deacetylase (PgdA/CDA1 family)
MHVAPPSRPGLRRCTGLLVAGLSALALAGAAHSGAALAECDGGDFGLARVVEIDASGAPIYGDITRRTKEANFLRPKEVVLTFDDGPLPWVTKSILDTLDKYCAKATFFQVGKMAAAYPGMVKDIDARGHTIGGHTWSHPFNMPKMKKEKAVEEIEKGLAAISLAAGKPAAPFFRFTGLSDSDQLLAYLQTRGIASFTVDVVSNDSYIGDAKKLAEQTIRRIEERKGGIVLFHDIKAATAKALPTILASLKEKGYRVVHMRPKSALVPLTEWDQALAPAIAKAAAVDGKKPMPFYGLAGPEKQVEVTTLAPEARSRLASAETAKGSHKADVADRVAKARARAAVMQDPGYGGWSTQIRRFRGPAYEDRQ